MTIGKQPMQANGSGTRMTMPDDKGELASRRGASAAGGESGGGAYPNPHSGGGDSKHAGDKIMGHGGQSEMAYHGEGQLGAEETGENMNAPSKEP